jgi:UPF0755 protein
MIVMKKYLDFKHSLIAKCKKISPGVGFTVLICILVFFSIFVFFSWSLTPVDSRDQDRQVFKVAYGSSVRQVGDLLSKKHLIRSRKVYEFYVRLNPHQRMAKAGFYRIGRGMSIPVIVRELQRGIPPTVRITIPEGFSNKEIADLLAKKGLVNPVSFIQMTKESASIREVMSDNHGISGMEGYLFPDTYNFELNAQSEREIIHKMVLRFKEIFQQNFPKIPAAKRREIVIIASLVEREAKMPEERPIIAGIFYNRLRLGYALQSCATVQYSLGKWKEHLYFKDLQVNSPYNTYLHQGLPPGPIANPGLASLKAAVFPAQVKYLYFVAKPDGTHVFSTTYAEHLNAQRKIARMAKNQGT